MDTRKKLGAFIRAERVARGKTIKETCETVGISTSHMSCLERGDFYGISDDMLGRVMRDMFLTESNGKRVNTGLPPELSYEDITDEEKQHGI